MNKIFDENELTFGSDPEIFACYYYDNKEFVEPAPIFRIERGVKVKNKNSNHPIFFENNEIKIIEDGVAFEFTVPPSNNSNDLFCSINRGIEITEEIVSKFGFGISIKPTINFDINRFNYSNYSEEIILSLIFGCDPDRDAIEENYISRVIDARFHPFRYGGGHFHIGSQNKKIVDFMHEFFSPFIKLLAITVGNLVIANSNYPELEKIRAEIYGRPGRFRIQEWGIEYRTPSNSWVENKELIELMIHFAKKAFIFLQNPKEGKEIINQFLPNTINIIKYADKDKANQIVNQIMEE